MIDSTSNTYDPYWGEGAGTVTRDGAKVSVIRGRHQEHDEAERDMREDEDSFNDGGVP